MRVSSVEMTEVEWWWGGGEEGALRLARSHLVPLLPRNLRAAMPDADTLLRIASLLRMCKDLHDARHLQDEPREAE